ncbi:MAG: transcription termination/antitermination protein NusA [Clostridia bacterium]|nr:transcription termination/antitermination protein NusA [Clostridia bacterium]
MNSELISALKEIAKQRNLSVEMLAEAIEAALVSAFKKNYNYPNEGAVRANLDRETGKIEIFASKSVVEEVVNPLIEISLENAKAINPLFEVGDVLEVESDTKDFGRIAAQTAKQVVMQRIREAEQGAIFEEYSEKKDEVLTAIVQRVEKNGVYVELGKTDGIIPLTEVIPGETYNTNDRIKVYVLKVQSNAKGPQIIASRMHRGLVKRLFELEIPEIQSGVVQIRSVAREAGQRTKIAVSSTDPAVDAVGACVGQRGVRVERIVSELHNEKMDIIEWDPDIAVYIAKALGPAKVAMVFVNEAECAARVIVPDSQLSLAIGKEGQNARLAAKLTGWKIDIKSQSQADAELENYNAENANTDEEGTFFDNAEAEAAEDND